MKKLLKHSLIAFIPILFLLLITFFINILVHDWRYAHKSYSVYQNPFNWASYKTEIVGLKFFRSLFYEKKIGLPAVSLYISEKSQQKLLNNTPQSTKEWVRGYFLSKNGNLKQIRIRYRGDNPINWMLEKKSLRIKTRKEEIFDRTRYIEYWPYSLKRYISGSVANRTGILSPEYKIVELFINDESSGVYIQTERVNEGFLRRNSLMPINIYKGEQNNTESLIGVDSYLFNNPGAWSKVAYFNQLDLKDKTDLHNFLNLLRKAEVDTNSFNELLKKTDLTLWSNLAAYQILTQNYHNDEFHNMRLAIDPWSGFVHPIVNDPIIQGDAIENNYLLPFETSSHSLFLLLNKSSAFIDIKYRKLFEYVKKYKVLSKEAHFLRSIDNNINTSSKRDIIFLRNNYKNIDWLKTLKKREIFFEEKKIQRDNFLKQLVRHQNNILKKLYSLPVVSWYKNLNGFSLYIDGEIPVSNLIVNFKSNVPNWIAIDANNNGYLDINEEKYRSNGSNSILMPIKLYSNRISVHDNINQIQRKFSTTHIKISRTKFNIISENSTKPYSITGTNPFSGESFKIDNLPLNGVLPSKYNKPIINKEHRANDESVKQFTGNITINEDLIIDQKSKIYPGTKFKLLPGASLIFRNKVEAIGSPEKPIIFEKNNSKDDPWGTIALQGKETQGSKLKNVIFKGGSGDTVNSIRYISMLSLHNTQNIKIEKLKMEKNYIYDDMLHIVYCKNIKIDDVILKNAYSDAIDVDMSKKIIIRNAIILNPKNDSIDLMETEALIESSYLAMSGDKGISAGENSSVIINNSFIHSNNIGLASKDKSIAYILYSDLKNNKTHLSAYKKNWRYGAGGNVYVHKSYFVGKTNEFNSKNESKVVIEDSSLVGTVKQNKKELISWNKVDYFDTKKTLINKKVSVKHPLFKDMIPVLHKNKRGSDDKYKNLAFSTKK